jgi:transposase-like protein
VAVAALKGDQTVNEVAAQFQVHPMQLSQWKKQALDGLPGLRRDRRGGREKDGQALLDSLYQQIGQLTVECDWLKKNLACLPAERRTLIDADHETLSVRANAGGPDWIVLLLCLLQ